MYPVLTLARLRVKFRQSLSIVVSLLVISSMLLRPVTAIAVIHQAESELKQVLTTRPPALVAANLHPLRAPDLTPIKAATTQRLAKPLPAPALRTLAQVNPTPSQAKPAYPYNHLLDGTYQSVGTPPTNHDFESAATGGGAPPTNDDFSATSYNVGTPPTNYNFESGTFSNWTTDGTVSIQSDATHGYWAQLGGSGKIISEPFTVDSSAQRISFTAYHGGSAGFRAYIHSGAGYATRTEIDYYYCNNCGWVDYQIDPTAYLGQAIKIEFLRVAATVGIDEIQMGVILPDYTVAGAVKRAETNGNAYARLAGSNATITSAPFTIGAGVQQVALLLSGLSSNSDQYRVQILSGATYSTVTQLGTGTVSDSWQQFSYNVSTWQGQAVKLRIASIYLLGTVGVDDIGVQSITLPGWTVSGATQVVDEGNGNHYVSTNGTLTSAAFVLDPNLQQISLRYRGDDGSADTFYVKLLRGANFSEEIDLAGYQAAGTTWQTLRIGLNLYAGETVKLKLQRHFGRIYFDDSGLGEIVLPGWQPTGTAALITASDSHGSYVTAADGNAFFIRSVPIALGVVQTNHVTARHYAVAYDIGQSTGSLLQIFWINDQGQTYTVFQDAADNPTGYRERYFVVYDALGTVGHFEVKATNGGKVYSIADNIARQHLNEPFSYKVGIQIDTATGAFGYQAQDLQIGGSTPLLFTRYYNGHSDRLGVMGYGWSHSYATRLVVTDDDDAGVVFGGGKEIFFTWSNSSQSFTPADARIHDELVKNGDGSYTFTTKAKQQYNFTAAGLLTTIKDPNNNTVTLAYDGNGQLGTATAQGGAAITLGYDGDGRLATVTDPLNAVTTYSYDGNGDLTSVARPDAGTEQYSYSSHRLSQVTDATGHILFQNSFDAYHRVVQQTDALGKSLTIQYNTPAAGVTTVTDPEGGVTSYYFDQYQRTTDWVAPTSAVTSYLYDNIGNLDKVIDGGAGEWDFAFDGNGNLLGSEDPLGNPTSLTYNPQHLPTSITDGNGNVTTMVYDAKGNVTQLTDALGGVTTFTYDSVGNLLTQTNALNQTETYTYDGAGNRLTRTDPLGYTWSWTYNSANRVTSETDANGHITQYFYDFQGRIVAIRNHLNQQKLFLYDFVGHLVMMEDELGQRTIWDYDDRGLVEAKTDPAGKVTTYSYDDNRNMVSTTDPVGLTTYYEYDAQNRLTKVIQPGGNSTQYAYDGVGNLSTQTDALGRTISYSYDDASRLTAVQAPNGGSWGYQYDANGNQTHVTDALNRTTVTTYDALNRASTVADPLNNVTTNIYDAVGRLIERKNPANQRVFYHYDAAGRMTTFTDALGQVTRYGYDGVGNTTVVTNTLGHVESTVYDALNRPTHLVDATGQSTQFVYDAVGRQTQVIQPTGATTNYGYDGRGLLTQVTNGLNQVTTYSYDNGSRLVQMTDAANQSTTYSYNNSGRLAALTNALGKTTSYGYDLVGNRTTVTDPLGRVTTTVYDNMNRVASVSDAGNRTTHYTYDLVGQVTQQSSPAGRTTTYTYDNRGQLTAITNALGQSESYAYNNLGQRTRVIDGRGNSAWYSYDAAGQLTSVTDALSGVVNFAYDAGGRLTSLTNANGKSTTFTYNSLGKLLTRTDPLNRTYTNSYDQYGRLATQTDARNSSISYGYDQLDRVTTVTQPNGTNSYTYDAGGRLSSVSDPTGTTSYGYDALSRITAVTTPQGTVGYSYNDAGQRTGMTLPGSRTIGYNYDATGRLANVTDWLSGVINYSFDADGNLTGLSRSNGVNSTYGYDTVGRLTAISHDGPGGNLLFTNYTLDANGNRTAVASNVGTESYTLDPLNRLTNVTYGNSDTAAYSYDANGNRLTQTFNGTTTNYSYDDAGQLLSDGSTTYGYDANGNLITAGANSFTWDWANRMTGATVGGNSASYAYDAFDVRVSGTVSGTAANYLWDRLAQYPTLVDDGANAYLHAAGPQAQIDSGGNRTYLLSDALSSIRGVTDASGALVGSTSYDAFGAIRSQTGTNSALGYTGEQYTPATGLLHLRARDLNPTLGRFLSADTVQPNAPGTQGFNVYAYVANNPSTWVDPSGHTVGLGGYTGTAALLPNVAAMGAITAMSIAAVLAMGRNPASWRFPENFETSGIILATFAVVLACALMGCMGAAMDLGGVIGDNGSDSFSGRRSWSLPALLGLPGNWPQLPTLPFQVGTTTQPGTATGTGTPPSPNPNPGPSGWFWPLAILTGLSLVPWLLPSPGENPGPATGPADDPFSPPGSQPTPTEDPTCSADVNYLIKRAEVYWKELDPRAQKHRTVALLRVKQNRGRCIDIVGSSGYRALEDDQRQIRLPNESFAHIYKKHAEQTVIFSAKRDLSKNQLIALGVSRHICEEICQPLIISQGGLLLPPSTEGEIRGAIWQ